VAWASGTKGTFLRTTDGGAHWNVATIPGAANLDFRDIHAVDERTAYLMSAGSGELSRIYKTTNGGEVWMLLATNLDPKGFFDCMSFWDPSHGILIGDAVDGRFSIFTTSDGTTWQKRQGPKADDGEAAFAASGTCIFTRGTREAWFGTGGKGGARVFHTVDGGESWTVAKTPVASDANSGIFSVAFSDGRRGVAIGGDYSKPEVGAFAETSDGGKTWTTAAGPAGYRSAVLWIPSLKQWLTAGTSGAERGMPGEWKALPVEGKLNGISWVGETGWAVGTQGTILKWMP
jgi:photosystem II stability/assembly factor-like uncharacterized protein